MAGRKRGEADTKASPAKKTKAKTAKTVTEESATEVVDQEVVENVEQEEEVAKVEVEKTEPNATETESETEESTTNPNSTVDEEKGTKDKLQPQPRNSVNARSRKKVISLTITNLTKNRVRLGSMMIMPKNEATEDTGVLVVTETNKIYSIMRSPVVTNLQRVGWIKVETKN